MRKVIFISVFVALIAGAFLFWNSRTSADDKDKCCNKECPKYADCQKKCDSLGTDCKKMCENMGDKKCDKNSEECKKKCENMGDKKCEKGSEECKKKCEGMKEGGSQMKECQKMKIDGTMKSGECSKKKQN